MAKRNKRRERRRANHAVSRRTLRSPLTEEKQSKPQQARTAIRLALVSSANSSKKTLTLTESNLSVNGKQKRER